MDRGIASKVDKTLKRILTELPPVMENGIARANHFLILFAAAAHATVGMPKGQIEDMPLRSEYALGDPRAACDNLADMADSLEVNPDDVPSRLKAFRNASAGSTQRIARRRVRFKAMYNALLP